MTAKLTVAIALTVMLGAPSALAGPCDKLAALAEHNGGAWPHVERLPQKVGDDGPWYFAASREDKAVKTFRPRLQADRARLLAEVQAKDPARSGIISSYLSPTIQAFGTRPDDDEIDYIDVHRWAGTSLYAVAEHDDSQNCERDWAYLYTGADGKVHIANNAGLDTCDNPGTGVWPGMAMVRVGPDLALVNEIRSEDALDAEADMTQDVAVWTGQAFAPACTLTYFHRVAYKISDQTRFEDANFHLRSETVEDRWLLANALRLMPGYLKLKAQARATVRMHLTFEAGQARDYAAQLATLKAYAGSNLVKAAKLKSAYDALVKHGLGVGEIVVPVTVGADDYLVGYTQEYSGKGPPMPYTDVTLYAVGDNSAERRASITLEAEPGLLLKVDAVLAEPSA